MSDLEQLREELERNKKGLKHHEAACRITRSSIKWLEGLIRTAERKQAEQKKEER